MDRAQVSRSIGGDGSSPGWCVCECVRVWGRRRRRSSSSTRPAAFEFSHTRPQNMRQIREQLYSRLEEVERHYACEYIVRDAQARQLPWLTLFCSDCVRGLSRCSFSCLFSRFISLARSARALRGLLRL
jgi:hypothetical protein